MAPLEEALTLDDTRAEDVAATGTTAAAGDDEREEPAAELAFATELELARAEMKDCAATAAMAARAINLTETIVLI